MRGNSCGCGGVEGDGDGDGWRWRWKMACLLVCGICRRARLTVGLVPSGLLPGRLPSGLLRSPGAQLEAFGFGRG